MQLHGTQQWHGQSEIETGHHQSGTASKRNMGFGRNNVAQQVVEQGVGPGQEQEQKQEQVEW